MGKMRFGKKKQVEVEGLKTPELAPKPQVIEKIVEKVIEVPVEVIKEVEVVKAPENTEIPKKYAHAEVDSLRKEMLKKVGEAKDKAVEARAKSDKIFRVMDEKLRGAERELQLLEKSMDELAESATQDIKDLKSEMITKIIGMRQEQAKSIKIQIALAAGLLISTLLHLL